MTRFIANSMLGRFTRWLRMLGHDVIYLNETSDDELLELAEGENRILLTRDLELYRRACTRELSTLYLKGRTIAEKLVEVKRRLRELQQTRRLGGSHRLHHKDSRKFTTSKHKKYEDY